MSLDALIDMSRRYGADAEYVLAGSGNTSYKSGSTVYVKASGTALADITEDGFVEMGLQALEETLTATVSEPELFKAVMAAKKQGQGDKRPSVESILHALFPYKYVLHLHPVIINGLTCSRNFESDSRRIFGDKVVCVPAMPPGPGLARLCNDIFSRAAQGGYPQIAFLQNHGIFAAADTTGEIDDLMTYVIDTLTGAVKKFPDMTDAAFIKNALAGCDMHKEPLTPEHVLSPDDEALRLCAVKIMTYAKSFGGVNPLPEHIAAAMREFNPYG